jgi:GNAT superfamily N-acetyltransferase
MLRTIRVVDELPDGFEAIVAAAAQEAMNGPRKILASWQDGDWSVDGAALFVGYLGGQIAGVGGVTPCPDVAGAARMRRFYVAPDARRSGVGRVLATAAMQEGMQWSRVLTCNASASAMSGPFWEALGFQQSDLPGVTHTYLV